MGEVARKACRAAVSKGASSSQDGLKTELQRRWSYRPNCATFLARVKEVVRPGSTPSRLATPVRSRNPFRAATSRSRSKPKLFLKIETL